MFDTLGDGVQTGHGGGPKSSLGVQTLATWAAGLTRVDRDVEDAQRIDQLRALEELKAAACAAQARISVDFAESQRAEAIADGVPADEAARGIGAQIALARRESPHLGNRLLGLAQALVSDMPHTLAALETGQLNEWRATLLVKGTACLSRADRTQVDQIVCSDGQAVAALGNKQLENLVKTEAYRADPHSVVERSVRAERERRVSLRPAPDTMTWLTALLPVAQGVAAYKALTKAAATAKSAGDERGRGQIMADTLVERVTGQSTADGVPVQVELIMNERTLVAADTEPAHLQGFGPLPATLAQRLIKQSPQDARRVRRLFTTPDLSQLVAMESKARLFPPALADFLVIRDQICRTPWCDAPIRHIDHVVDHAKGGPTAAANAQGLCEACNHTKTLRNWRARLRADGATHTVETTTPTGHKYESRPPDPPGFGDGANATPQPPTFTKIRIRWRDVMPTT